MKKIFALLFFLPILFGVLHAAASADGERQTSDGSLGSLALLPDSVKTLIAHKKFLVYDYGHHGKKWCLIYNEGDSYNFIIGTTRNEKLDISCEIDTVKLFDTYRNLITWGMDTLPAVTKDMKWQYSDISVTFYSSLRVFDATSVCVFDSNNANGFDGPNSKTISKDFLELCYLMRWLSAPEIRDKLPRLNVYLK